MFSDCSTYINGSTSDDITDAVDTGLIYVDIDALNFRMAEGEIAGIGWPTKIGNTESVTRVNPGAVSNEPANNGKNVYVIDRIAPTEDSVGGALEIGGRILTQAGGQWGCFLLHDEFAGFITGFYNNTTLLRMMVINMLSYPESPPRNMTEFIGREFEF